MSPNACPHLLLIASLFVGCSPQSQQTTAARPRESPMIITRAVPTEAQKATMLAAKEVLFQRLSARLMTAMSDAGPAGAITVCQKEAAEIAKSVGEEHGVKIGRVGVRLRNQENTAPDWAGPLTQAKTDSPTFVTLSSGDVAALLPIKLQTQCVMCHGTSEQIAPVVQEQLARLYPNDRATGFAEGELRGWFWVELPSSL